MAEQQEESTLVSRHADYIKRAEEAEGMAAHAKGETARDTFQMIASGWRQLAERVKAALKSKTPSQ